MCWHILRVYEYKQWMTSSKHSEPTGIYLVLALLYQTHDEVLRLYTVCRDDTLN